MEDSPAIKALGSFFKLTEVFLWDDGFPNDDDSRPNSSCPKHIRFKYDDDDEDDDNGIVNDNDDSGVIVRLISPVETSEDSSIMMEDGHVLQEMSELGLPLSFRTSKQSYVQMKGKSKAMQCKDDGCQTTPKDYVQVSQEVSRESLQDKSSNTSLLSLPDRAEHSCSDSEVSNDNVRLSGYCKREKPANVAAAIGSGDLEKPLLDQVPNDISSESLIDDKLGTVFRREPKMMSVAARSDSVDGNISCACDTLDGCAEESPKEMDKFFIEQKQTKGGELGGIAMLLEDLYSSICYEQTPVDDMPKNSSINIDLDANDAEFSATRGAWSAYWDSYYMRYYFVNTETQVSTWYPPPGMENLAPGIVSDMCNESIAEVTANATMSPKKHLLELVEKTCSNGQVKNTLWGVEELSTKDSRSGIAMDLDLPCVFDGSCEDGTADKNCNDNVIIQLSHSSSLSSIIEDVGDDDVVKHVHMNERLTVTNGVCHQDAPAATKQKKKRKNRRRKKSFNNYDNPVYQPVKEYVDITKYWCQRYLLFSKFDDGVQMDDEGWFSVTPEAIAIHHASRLGGGIVVDCFAGVGGNAIQFAKTSKHVIGIDIDPKKINYAHHNAAIYGVEDKIDFINGDCFSLVPKLKAETIFLSPPWGGPDYLNVKSYGLDMLQPYHGQSLFNNFKLTASLIAMFLPRNVDIVQLAELSLSCNTPWSLEVEKNFLNGKLKAVTAYFRRPVEACSFVDYGC